MLPFGVFQLLIEGGGIGNEIGDAAEDYIFAWQVLLSEEISGSLRQLKGTALLALERYKSLQKRGIIEPRVKASLRRQKRRKQIFFTPGETSEKLKAGHEETQRIITKGAQQRAALKKLPKS